MSLMYPETAGRQYLQVNKSIYRQNGGEPRVHIAPACASNNHNHTTFTPTNNSNLHKYQIQHYNNQQVNSQQSCSQMQLAVQNKRKEKARIAARARRSQEASIILEMAEELHITHEKIRRIDKATIVKLAIDYIRAFEILCRFCIERVICVQPGSGPTRQLATSGKSLKFQNTPDEEEEEEERETATEQLQLIKPPTPKLSTSTIFTPKTNDMDLNFLMIDAKGGKESFVLKPDEEILDEDDLTHLAPQAGEVVTFEVDPLEEILEGVETSTSLFLGAPPVGSC